MVDCCEECGTTRGIELHHIVFRSKASYMANIDINFKFICNECHRGNKGPHLNREKDLEYKIELQYKISEMFESKFYSAEEIRDKLKTTDKEVRKIVKTLMVHPEGYSRIDLIVRLMGGRLYIK